MQLTFNMQESQCPLLGTNATILQIVNMWVRPATELWMESRPSFRPKGGHFNFMEHYQIRNFRSFILDLRSPHLQIKAIQTKENEPQREMVDASTYDVIATGAEH